MNAKLRGLLVGGVAGGTLLIAGIATVALRPKPDTTRVELVDGGVRVDCNPRRVACTAYVDGGYQEREFDLWVCPTGDGGAVETIWPDRAFQLRKYLLDEDSMCRRLANPTPAQMNTDEDPPEKQGSCACWNPDAGPCSDDGGMVVNHNEAQPGTWSGVGCVPKVCGQLMGIDNWPAGCPR